MFEVCNASRCGNHVALMKISAGVLLILTLTSLKNMICCKWSKTCTKHTVVSLKSWYQSWSCQMIKAFILACCEVQMIGIVLLYPFNMFELSNYLSVWKLLVIVRSPTWHEVRTGKAVHVINHNYILTVHCQSCD